jgi:hypothetical protein
MDAFPASFDGPEYELQSIARSLEDLTPAETAAPRPDGVMRPLFWTAAALVALMTFVGWLLLS